MGSPYCSNHLLHSQTSAKSTITCFYTNADCLLNERNELKARLSIIQPDILTITEVWPKKAFYLHNFLGKFTSDGYDLFCFDLSVGSLRGVRIYCKSNLIRQLNLIL